MHGKKKEDFKAIPVKIEARRYVGFSLAVSTLFFFFFAPFTNFLDVTKRIRAHKVKKNVSIIIIICEMHLSFYLFIYVFISGAYITFFL